MTSKAYDQLVQDFCRAVRQRSQDHKKAVEALVSLSVPSVIIAILRQELDSMVRVIYLLSVRERQQREAMLRQTALGNQWNAASAQRAPRRRVTDRQMVTLARAVDGEWVQLLYDFGCSFIHLSGMHDNYATDPYQALPEEEREDLARLVNQYWGPGSLTSSSEFGDLVKLLPNIRGKVSSKLEEYLLELESDGELTEPLQVG